MAIDLNRRAFLRGKPKLASSDIALPWSNHQTMTESCNRCGDCKSICPEKIIKTGDGGFPTLDFANGECSFCGKCMNICKENVFNSSQTPILNAQATIKLDNCLPEKGIHCESCRDMCEEGAITMEMRIGLPPKPLIDTSKCTGCGACYKPCPTIAIEIENFTPKMKQGELAYA